MKSKALAVIVGLAVIVAAGLYLQQTGAEATAEEAVEGNMALTTADYVEIRNLYAKYNHYVDTGKDEGWAYANLWTEDGTFHINLAPSRIVQGAEELAVLANGAGTGHDFPGHGPTSDTRPHPIVKAAHHAVNVMIEPSPEGAMGSAYLLMINSPATSQSEHGLSAIYTDRLVKTPEGWKYKMRTLDLATPGDTSREPDDD